jgi:predicted transcriptional regulator
MARLGELERAVMELMWAAPSPLSAADIVAALPGRELAVTTVLTVLDRLRRKEMVTRHRDGRAFRFTPVSSREELVAETMVEALGGSDDRGAALARFIESVSEDDAELLRKALRRHR